MFEEGIVGLRDFWKVLEEGGCWKDWGGVWTGRWWRKSQRYVEVRQEGRR